MEKLPGLDITIAKTSVPADLEWCARLATANEPWITLQRGYEDSLQLLLDPIADVYLLSKEQERVGFIVVRLKGSFTGYIQTIAISKQFREQGIGEAAMRYIESVIFKTSPNVFICVSSFNKRALKLYRRMGYESVGMLRDYILVGYDELLMRKTSGSWNDFRQKS
jgi:ribosomal-protein-alanine N-acetyltransferase